MEGHDLWIAESCVLLERRLSVVYIMGGKVSDEVCGF